MIRNKIQNIVERLWPKQRFLKQVFVRLFNFNENVHHLVITKKEKESNFHVSSKYPTYARLFFRFKNWTRIK